MIYKHTWQGFTLIELLVVVLVIGILIAIVLPQYQVAVAKTRVIEALVILDALAKAEEVFYLENGEYTNDISELPIDISLLQKGSWATGNHNRPSQYVCNCFEKRSCRCGAANVQLPQLEFYLMHGINSGARSNRTCIVAYPANAIATKVCKSFSSENPTSSNVADTYYMR